MTVWLVIALAVLGANAPFLSQRHFFVIPNKVGAKPKSMGSRLRELVVMYGVIGGVALGLEYQAGQIAPQGWEFYAITATLFITLAFPGFVYRYLFKHRG